MEIKLENLKLNDWELNTTLSSEDIIGITGPEYEEVLEILSLKEIAEGQIMINEETITKENQYEYYKKISLVQKDLKKINYLNTIKEHMDFIINYYHLQIKNIEKKEKDSLKIVGLDSSLLDRNITSLSKSEQKKVQIAISLLSNPEIMILDEPFKSLDNKSRKKIMMILTKLKEQYHKIIIIGSNNADILYQYTTKMLFVKNKRIFLEGSTQELYERVDYLKRNGYKIPEIVLFTYKVIKKKKVKLEYHKDIRDIIKDIYKHVWEEKKYGNIQFNNNDC